MSSYYTDEHKYDDIIGLPHHQSKERPHMSLHDRAAQFAPFAALSGYEEAIEETARFTEEKIMLDETEKERINEKLQEISNHLSEAWTVSVTHFLPDKHKRGGKYLTDIGTIKKIDETQKVIVMDSGAKIPMEYIYEIEIR